MRRGTGAIAGLAAVAAALGTAELVAGVFERAPSLVIAVGDVVIDSVPGWLERAAIATLGRADKPVLIGGILLISVLLGAALGVLARRRFLPSAAGFVAFAALGVAAALTDPRTTFLGALLVGAVGAAVGVGVLHLLIRAARADRSAGAAAPPAAVPAGGARPGRVRRSRRTGAASWSWPAVRPRSPSWPGWGLPALRAGAAGELRAAIRLPAPFRRAAPVTAGADLDIPGLTPLVTPNEEFYRIDTALRVPVVEPDGWQLEVRGMVDEPFTLTYAELLELPQIEADITLACVSNEVGGDLVGNARWQGVPLRALLERAGLQEGATQLLGRSVDGFTAGFPVLTALDVEEAMVAVAMNGEPLPAEHGFPARLVVPGLYGYVSATKWLSAIELTGWDVDGYWIPRGWAKEGPIKTQARIDVPRAGGTVSAAERQVIAGVAWAPTRGIEGVEVRIDDGPWRPAELAERLDVDCWRQWYLPWDATPGRHVIAARATDGLGEVQTDERTPVAPDGASGYPVVEVEVEA
ncbi:molybdopterin-dependent oxidoreductase [Blastococcus brunescens]|uniref:Molybdopterin-dependent oxidoreductase n=1 Tax=Blastococcus brunescens TaxID=1564165 RepID=A0ABZ1B975_9ACTN|nr:molybdopterin-dependent oxidoreductase [Blastococcus sp. BMG 8361]WRL66363.1 molybdopterin-dependent oxidoreductase [Blastococcus sp. BMG 8361]